MDIRTDFYMKINIAIVEDEDQAAASIEQFLEQFGREQGSQIRIKRYTDGTAIAGAESDEYDIILMDIMMGEMDGMTAAEKIRERGGDAVIIFITNRTDYAIRGYQVDALDYVLKPLNYLSFSRTLKKAIEKLNNRRGQKVVISTRSGKLFLDAGDICYVESQGHNITYSTLRGDVTVRGRIQDVEENLVPMVFFRSNKGYLVNLRHVDGVQDECALVNGKKLPVSRSRKAPFMAALTRFMGES